MSKSHRSLCVSFSRTDSGLCIYHLFVWSNLNFLHNSQWITLPAQSCQVYTLSVLICCIHLLCDRWICLYHHITYICCFVALIWLVLIAVFCAAIRRDSVSLLNLPFLGHVQVFLFKMFFISRLKSFFLFFVFLVIVVLLVLVLSVLFLVAVISLPPCMYVVFKLYWCDNIVFRASKSSSSLLFLTHHLWDVMPYARS